MKFTETPLSGCFVVEQERRGDDRGHFARVFCTAEFAAHGLCAHIEQANAATSFDVAVDLRPDSATRGSWFGIELDAAQGNMLFVPKGFAHGYLTLEDDTEMHYMVSAAYAPGSEQGYCWNDPAFAIEWPITDGLTLSDKDTQWPAYSARD